MLYLISLILNGLLAGTVYALIALAFVVVYKSSRMINFAVGEWIMFGGLLTATGLHVLALPLTPALLLAAIGMTGLATLFGRLVLRRMTGRPLVAMIMITLGLGALLRGIAAIMFQRVPSNIPLPLPSEPLMLGAIMVPIDRLLAAVIAGGCIGLVSWFYRASRTGLALRAIADSQTLAAGMGINVQRHFTLTWALAGVIAVVAGVLWTATAGGGIGAVLVGLKVFPIVIIGGLDSIVGTIIGAMIVGLIESLTAGYVDASFGTVASSLLLIAALLLRPHGLFGRVHEARV